MVTANQLVTICLDVPDIFVHIMGWEGGEGGERERERETIAEGLMPFLGPLRCILA
jgi:hypothetical protein